MSPAAALPNLRQSALRRQSCRSGALLLLGLTLPLAGCPRHTVGPVPAPVDNNAFLSAFFKGVTALEVGDNDRARLMLATAVKLAPDEPAAWADQALILLRTQDSAGASAAIARAVALRPNDSQIQFNAGVIASDAGQTASALSDFRKAVQLDPKNVQAQYALVDELDRSPDPASAVEKQKRLEAILTDRPHSLVVMLDLARIAAQTRQAKLLKQMIEGLKGESSTWPADALAQLTVVQNGVSGDPRALVPDLLRLGNLLKPTDASRAETHALKGTAGLPGEPIDRPLVRPFPSSEPAPPDTTLHFTPNPVGGAGGSVLWARAINLGADEAPAVLSATSASLQIGRVHLWLPGGPYKAFPPTSVLPIDWNNDGKVDLALACAGGLRLWQQTPQGQFKDVTAATGLPANVINGSYTGVWAIDIELDGDLDMVLGSASGPPTVLQNDRDGTWKPIHPFEGISGMRAFAWIDLDGDGLPDAAIVDGSGALSLFQNERGGVYRKVPGPTSSAPVLTICTGDRAPDGRPALDVLYQSGAISRASFLPNGQWEITPLSLGTASPADDFTQLFRADLDNNGAADLVASGPKGSRFWLSGTGGTLRIPGTALPCEVFSVADRDGDGRIDLMGIDPSHQPTWLMNSGTKAYHWQEIRPRAAVQADGRNNIFGLGGQVEVRAGLLDQVAPITGSSVHIGLGTNPGSDYARIFWPNGSDQAEFDLKPDTIIRTPERLLSSCPWLFAWNGKKFDFVTDLIWRSPLGLKINAQDTAGVVQTRDWVKIRGEQLVPRQGFYDLRVTAELWETHFFDYLSLKTVDHPVGTEVYVDERFCVPPPALAAVLTSPVQPVTRAMDDLGKDVTAIVQARDGRYLDTFGRSPFQGVTRDHTLELDLGPEIPVSDQLMLVAEGWIHPTDSSINVALSQGKRFHPSGLSLEVLDRNGQWRVARSGLGFPEGKNKTILIDLKGVFARSAPGVRRLRLRTNLEIYWDFIGAAVRLPPGPAETHDIALSSAELRYRGFSAILPANASSPGIPDYQHIARTGPQWLDLAGFYTRFGDIRDLLTKVDDRYAILNAGDEMVLQFPAGPPPRPGWRRDFVLVADGWEKDGNFNTGFSGTVLPLPSHNDPAYNHPPGRLQDDPVYKLHKSDWMRYHTRYVAAQRPVFSEPAATTKG